MFSVSVSELCFCASDFEASFIRLLDKVTNGTRIEINQTGEFHIFIQAGWLLSVVECNEVQILRYFT